MTNFRVGHASFFPNGLPNITSEPPPMPKVKTVAASDKLEQYAWEVYKLRNESDKYTLRFEVQAEFAYEVAEAFLKYTEEKFNE